MKILELRTLRGPNYWSVRRPLLIQLKLDLGPLEERPTNLIPGFYERLQNTLPSLYDHRCSEGVPGGFFSRVQTGTWMGHVVEHIALELQTLAGTLCSFGQTRSTSTTGVYHVVFEYKVPEAGAYAAKAAVRIAQALITGQPAYVEEEVRALHRIAQLAQLGPSTSSLVQEAERRGIPWRRLGTCSLIQLGYGKFQKRLRATIAGTTSNLAVDIAGDKNETKQLLTAYGIPVPTGELVHDPHELQEAVARIGFPLVVKPVDGNHGRGATINIITEADALNALKRAQEVSPEVIVERFIQGFDFRFLVIDYKLVAVAKRTPACVLGDGVSTVQQLIDAVNADPARGDGHDNMLTQIVVDAATEQILKKNGLNLASVPPAGQVFYLKETANLSTGGTATDVTDTVHATNRALAEQIARVIGLDICGIDIMAPEVATPIQQNGGAILEVNAAPGFRMHLAPSSGQPRNVAAPVLDMLFPPQQAFRMPIVAVTGTNGKTTTARIVAHIAQQAGHHVGLTTTEGIYIDNKLVEKGDTTGPRSAERVLHDPLVDFAVLETARGGILREGTAFRYCDVGIVTNVASDHLGLGGIDTLEQLTRVKRVIPETVTNQGTAVLNADDDRVVGMQEGLSCRIALFSMNASNPKVHQQVAQGGVAAVLKDGNITLLTEASSIVLAKAAEVPITFGGTAGFMIQNVLAAALGAYVQGIPVAIIRQGLLSFEPSPELNPGRMNLLQVQDYQVLVDYAHNPAGFMALGSYLQQFAAHPKVGIITGVGDRRAAEIEELGHLAANMFDEIIIRMDGDGRGRTQEEIYQLLVTGIHQEDGSKPIRLIANEIEAVRFALDSAQPGALLVITCEDIDAIIALVRQYQQAPPVRVGFKMEAVAAG